MTRDSFIFYRSFYESAAELSPKDRAAFYEAIINYAFTGEEPETKGIVKAVFLIAKQSIDANNKKYEMGKKGGRPKKETNGFENKKPMVSKKENQRFSKTKSTETDTETDTETVTDTDTETGEVLCEGDVNPYRPNIDDVREYIAVKGFHFTAEEFMEYYDSVNWMVKQGVPLTNWMAKCPTFERNWKERQERLKNRGSSGSVQIPMPEYIRDQVEGKRTADDPEFAWLNQYDK